MEATQRSRLFGIVGWALAIYVMATVGVRLVQGVADLRAHPLESHANWGAIALSGLIFLLAHAVLVATWRSVLACWHEHLSFWSAARVWSVSNLARYLPGSVWQIGVMAGMARELSVSPIAASGSALLGTLVNIVAGFVVALVSGRALLLRHVPSDLRSLAIAAVVAAVVALFLLPFIIPLLAPALGRLLGRPVVVTLPARAIIYSLVGNTIAWLAYGAAFQVLVRGVLGMESGGYTSYLAAYTSSYLIGYIFIFVPAGLGIRELAMLEFLQLAGLATPSQAALVTLTSRLWLTLIEVTPAILFLAHYRMRRCSPTPDPSDVPT